MCCKIVPFLMDLVVCFTNLNWLIFYKGLLSFNRVFAVLLTPGGFGNKVSQNITVEWRTFSPRCVRSFRRSCVLLLRFFVVGLNLSKCVAKSCLFQWIWLFCFTKLNWLLFYKGSLSFNRVFCVLLTPGGFGNKAFQNITVEWIFFSLRCLCVVFRRSCVLLLRFLVVGLNLSKCVAKSRLFQWSELFWLTNLNCLLFYTSFLLFNRVFCVLLTPEGLEIKCFKI